jgi:hypothetical protein
MALSAPQGSGDVLNPADIENHTLVVCPTEFIPHIKTQFTKDGEISPAIRVNVADLSAEGGPAIYRGVMWFNVKLYNGLRRQIGETILGRMTKGQATPGQSAPWQLQDIMQEANWVQYAEQWLATDLGQSFELLQVEDIQAAERAASQGGQQAAPVAAAPPAPAGPPAAVTPNFGGSQPPSAPPAPPTTPAAPPAPVAGPPASAVAAPVTVADPMAALAGLPPEELQKMLAVLQQQQNASS